MIRFYTTSLGLLAVLLSSELYGATMSVYLSPPSDQASSIGGVTTETFDSTPLGIDTSVITSGFGSIQLTSISTLAILTADQYGGANGTDYAALGAQSNSSNPVTADLSFNANYFGMWWSAGDANNGIGFYNNDVLLVHFKTADIVGLLTPMSGQVTALNGSTYNNSQYYGNPNNISQDANEPFAYVNFVTSGAQFNRIVFDNSGTTGTGFEIDNLSIYSTEPLIPATHVLVEVLPSSPTPEPSTMLLSCVALAVTVLTGRGFRRRRHRA